MSPAMVSRPSLHHGSLQLHSHPSQPHGITAHPSQPHSITAHPSQPHSITAHPPQPHSITTHPSQPHSVTSHASQAVWMVYTEQPSHCGAMLTEDTIILPGQVIEEEPQSGRMAQVRRHPCPATLPVPAMAQAHRETGRQRPSQWTQGQSLRTNQPPADHIRLSFTVLVFCVLQFNIPAVLCALPALAYALKVGIIYNNNTLYTGHGLHVLRYLV